MCSGGEVGGFHLVNGCYLWLEAEEIVDHLLLQDLNFVEPAIHNIWHAMGDPKLVGEAFWV